MTLREELATIAKRLGHLDRDGVRGKEENKYRFHSENGVRNAIKAELERLDISFFVKKIDTEVIMPNVSQAGNRAYTTFIAKSTVEIELVKNGDIETFVASAADIGDSYSNASSSATTLAIRNWMKAQFQITYDPDEEIVVEDMAPSLEMSAAMIQNAKLIITKAVIANVKKAAKDAGYKPSSWNLNKMTEEDLFHCSGIAVALVVKSSQAKSLDLVSKDIEHE